MKQRILFILSLFLLTASCAHAQTVSTEKAAIKASLVAIHKSNWDTSQQNMMTPQSVQVLTLDGKKAWRVAWGLKKIAKGGQIVAIVYESGKVTLGAGE